jgi:hypothetical protein
VKDEDIRHPMEGGKETELAISFMLPFTLLRFARYFFTLLQKYKGKQERLVRC